IANKSKRKERKYHEWRLCTSAIGEKERSVSNRSRRRDCRDFGPSTSLHVIWLEDSTCDRRRPAGAAGYPWRRRHLHSGCPPAFLYRVLGGGGLRWAESEAALYGRAAADLRLVVFGRGRS